MPKNGSAELFFTLVVPLLGNLTTPTVIGWRQRCKLLPDQGLLLLHQCRNVARGKQSSASQRLQPEVLSLIYHSDAKKWYEDATFRR